MKLIKGKGAYSKRVKRRERMQCNGMTFLTFCASRLRVEQGWEFGNNKALAVYGNDLCRSEVFGSLRKNGKNYTRGGVCFCISTLRQAQ